MKQLKRSYIIIFILIVLSIVCFGASYAIFMNVNEQHGKLNIVVGDLTYQLESSDLENNQITVEANTVKEITIKLTSLNTIDSKYELYYIGTQSDDVQVGYSKDTKDAVLGTIEANGSKTITIVIHNESDMSTTVTFGVIGGLTNNDLILKEGYSLNQEINKTYAETILNGADPVLTDNLVPILIADDGTVTKAGLNQEWYSYTNQRWANAVVLKDTSISYNVGDTIPETNIESYFVWIPRYKYKIFNTGSYTGLTSISSKEQIIEVVFENKDTPPSSGTTVGSYLTHPAFTAFDTNGLWVGKFETGYDGATSTSTAQVNSNDSSKIIIKPNVYSWRNMTVGNAFDASYNYLRSNESHMMKNTEWGAVAYLQHSAYGSQTSVRVNNNSAYITGYAGTTEPTKGYSGTSIDGNRYESTALNADGTYTKRYNSTVGYTASTTGNITGVYDMSGGAYEYVMGYTTGAGTVGGLSGITSIYSDFFTNSSWNKYYDKYKSTETTNYNYRILGDATGEMGPFGSQIDPDNGTRYKSSWYEDFAYFAQSSFPWFVRGGARIFGSSSGIFAFNHEAGGVAGGVGFRVVLAPQK